MANLKEVRIRISSVNSTMQITSAMKMVSAAKLKRAQDNVIQLRPYANKLQAIIKNVSAGLDASENIYSKRKEHIKNILVVAVSSNRGLAGAFNSNVNKKVNEYVSELNQSNPNANITILPIGKKVAEYAKKRKLNIYSSTSNVNLLELSEKPKFDNASILSQEVINAFVAGKFDQIVLIYNLFKNTAVQIPTVEDFLPLKKSEEHSKISVDYIFEPNREYIIQELIPQTLKTQLFKVLLDSLASEHGARMTAMHKATDNAKELLRSLKIAYNKARQAAITTEILEIVAGAEALKGN